MSITKTASSTLSLPIQLIPFAEKTKAWKEKNMDRLEQIGKDQILHNVKLVENYELIKGKFIYNHYFETEQYSDILTNLTKEFELPSYLRHYDIISQVINVLSGEYQKRPDNFKVRAYDEESTNEFLRKKTSLLLNYVTAQIEQEVQNKLLEEGIDVTKSDFTSDQEKQEYDTFVQERTQVLTPPEIELYMNSNWETAAEIWGAHQLESDKQRFNLAEKEKKEFEDMLTADRCFRHFYLTGDSYGQETWNPVNTFYHKSPEIENIEEGDYVGRILYMTPSSIINKFGWMMTKSEIMQLESNRDEKNNRIDGVDGYGIAYGSHVPWENYSDYTRMKDAFGVDPYTSISPLDEHSFSSLLQNNQAFNLSGLYQVTEGYWMSQRKIGKIIYIDDDGLIQKELIDETFIIPPGFKQVNSNLYESADVNTITWTYINEVWKGVKINPLLSKKEAIYLNIAPLEFQFKSESNPYGARLPVCGQIFNNRNGESMSLVDLMKPHQIGYNVSMNQLYQVMEREVGRFILMDVNLMPNLKDWGGERSWEKFMMVAKSLGFAPADSSPENLKGANPGGQLPQVIDLDESARMMSRIKLAEFFEIQALKQIGFNPQRLGNTSASESATGVQQAMTQSFSSTESYFTNFNNYKRRCFTMNLDIAQYVQSKKDDVRVNYTKSDMSRAFIQLNGTDLLLRDLGIYITNSQENIRQLETLKQLALTNNTSDATMDDLATIVTSNSPKEIKLQLRKSREQKEKQEQQAAQLEQQRLTQAQELQQNQQNFQSQENQLDRENKKEIAYINTFSRQDSNLTDIDQNNVPDLMEYDKFAEQQKQNQLSNEISQNKIAFDREKFNRTQVLEREKMAQDDRELAVRQKIEQQKLKTNKKTNRT